MATSHVDMFSGVGSGSESWVLWIALGILPLPDQPYGLL